MKIIFLRHGESEYNVRGLINQDPKFKVALTKRGKKQANEIAEKLKDNSLDIIISSEFPRARETAAIISRIVQASVEVDSRINETRVGFEGLPAAEYNEAAGDDLLHFKFEGGEENWVEMKSRVQDFLNELKAKEFNSVLVVTHEWIMQAANGIAYGLSDEEAHSISFGNCDFVEFEL